MTDPELTELAARAWTAPTTSHLPMQPEVVKEFARILGEFRETIIHREVVKRETQQMAAADNGMPGSRSMEGSSPSLPDHLIGG